VVGASATEGAFGSRLLSSIVGWSYRGQVYPVNPRHERLAGRDCYPDLASVPEPVDCVAFAIRDDRLPQAMESAADAGARAGVVFGRGYFPPGTARPTPGDRWAGIAREAGMAICGDNCMGLINAVDRLRISANPAPSDEPPGGVVLLSHSGSSWSGLVGSQRQLGLSYAVSMGRESVTDVAGYMEFAIQEADTRVIALLLETVRDPARFALAMAAARAHAIPVVALKLGRSTRGRHFARSHSGAIAGSAEAMDAFFEHLGIASVRSLDELTDTVEMFRSTRVPTTGAVGFGTDSGGERQLICDTAADLDVPLAEFSTHTRQRLAAVLDPGLEPLNPVDYWGDGRVYFEDCLKIVAEDPGVGMVVMATNMVSGRQLLNVTTRTVLAVAAHTQKPVAKLGHLHSTVDRSAAAALREQGIPVLMGTTTGLAAIGHFLAHHRRRASVDGDDPPLHIPAATRQQWHARLQGLASPLPVHEALQMLRDFQVPAATGVVVSSLREALEAAGALGFPLVAKTANVAVLHRSDVGGVRMNIEDDASLAQAYTQLASELGCEVLLQRQCGPGVELLLGVVVDEALGAMASVGIGGVLVEIYRDVVTFVPPVGPARARALLRRLRGHELLEGVRGAPAVDLEALARAISGFSVLAADLGPLEAEADVNPLIADRHGVLAVDALFVPGNPHEGGHRESRKQ
jgi:acyl-CoA synthetase (NDP forming)